MKVIEQHTTPDGLLKFIVADYGDDRALGFDGFPSHTHPECLPPFSTDNWQATVKRIVEDLLADRLAIGLCRKNGKLVDAWIETEPKQDKYKPDDEEIEYRYWSGRKYDKPIH